MRNPSNIFKKHLTSLGHLGAFNDQQMKFLKDAGYTGQLNDMWKKYFAANSYVKDFSSNMRDVVAVVVGGGSLVVAGDPYEYWRLKGVTQGSFAGGGVSDIEFRATAGSADQTSGGTPISLSEFNGSLINDNAFDDVDATEWAGTSLALSAIGYQFASPVSCTQISLRARETGGTGSQVWSAFDIERSTDGIVWATEWSETSVPVFSDGERRTFTKP